MPGAMRMYKNKLPRNREWRIGRSERVRSGLSFSLTVNRENVVNVRNTRGLSTTALTRDGEREARGCGAREAEGDRAPAGGRGAWGETESRGRARRAAPGSERDGRRQTRRRRSALSISGADGEPRVPCQGSRVGSRYDLRRTWSAARPGTAPNGTIADIGRARAPAAPPFSEHRTRFKPRTHL